MKAFLILLLLCLPNFSFANEECTRCMADCPHNSKEMRACDRGCPQVCTKIQLAEIQKAQSCESCLAECPHNSREFRACDGGCVKACDRDAILNLFKKVKGEKAACEAARVAADPATAPNNP